MTLALTGCGQDGSDGQGVEAEAPSESPTLTEEPTSEAEEQITPEGIATVVVDHFGEDAVRRLITYEPEPGSVMLVVRLDDPTPHNFIVQVLSPEVAQQIGRAGECPQQTERGSVCRELDDGTILATRLDPEGFSDDNEDGVVVSGTIVREDDAAMAMFESYDDTPAVSTDDVEALLTDPRLTWLTDPAVNEAGQGLSVKYDD